MSPLDTLTMRRASRLAFSLTEITPCLLQAITCDDPDIRAVMEMTHDRETDVVASFCGKDSDNRFEPLLSTQLP